MADPVLIDLECQEAFYNTAIVCLSKNAYHIETSSHKWECWDAGTGQQMVVLLHGGIIGPEMWFYPAFFLSREYRVIMPRIPDGLSNISDVLEFYRLLLARDCREKAVLMGYSYGGGVAQIIVDHLPERVSAIVLSHTRTMWDREPNEARTKKALIKILPTSLFRKLFASMRVKDYPDSNWNEFHRKFFTDRIMELDKQDLFDFSDSAFSVLTDFNKHTSTVNQFQGSVILLATEGDADAFDALPSHRKHFPNAVEHVFKGSGGHHFLFLHPEKYTTKLMELLQKVT